MARFMPAGLMDALNRADAQDEGFLDVAIFR
jgi:hypothetical protein